MPLRDWNDIDVREIQKVLIRSYFLPQDVLLIGADTGLYVNEECKASFGHIKNALRRAGALRTPKTTLSRRILDGYNIQMSASAMGFGSFGGQIA